MPWSGDTQAYLDALYVARQSRIGISRTGFSDQFTFFDAEALDREIARVERVLYAKANGTGSRYAATSKGC